MFSVCKVQMINSVVQKGKMCNTKWHFSPEVFSRTHRGGEPKRETSYSVSSRKMATEWKRTRALQELCYDMEHLGSVVFSILFFELNNL